MLFNIFFLASGCVQKKAQQFESRLGNEASDEALRNLPERDILIRMKYGVYQLAGHLASYTFITAFYTSEVLWDGASGTLVVIGLCGPGAAVAHMSNSSSGKSSMTILVSAEVSKPPESNFE